MQDDVRNRVGTSGNVICDKRKILQPKDPLAHRKCLSANTPNAAMVKIDLNGNVATVSADAVVGAKSDVSKKIFQRVFERQKPDVQKFL